VSPTDALSIIPTGSLDEPKGIAVDSSDDVYVADSAACEIEKISANGSTRSVIAGSGSCAKEVPGPALSSPLDYPQGVALGPDGSLFVADTDNCTVDEITPGGTLSVVAGIPGTCGPTVLGAATSSPLDYPDGVTVDSAGNVYIADTENDQIDKVTPSGILSVAVGDGEEGEPVAKPPTEIGLDEPEDVAIDASGDLYIADSGNRCVERVTPAGNVEVLGGSPGHTGLPSPGPAQLSLMEYPSGVAVNAAGTELVIGDEDNDDVEEITGF
jgi:sugar lactone lactonase YvrE